MKKLVAFFCLALTIFLFSGAQAQIDTLTILHVNDTHAHLLSYGPKDTNGDWTWGGWARLGTVIGMTRMTEPNVIALHSGDIFVGDFMFQQYLGIAELEIMKALSFDAMELGNHEFDLYPSTLKYVLNEAGFPGEGFPVLCANLDMTGDPEMAYFVTPYTIKEMSGIRIGVIGLLTDLTNDISSPAPNVVLPPLSVAQSLVTDLRDNQNCDMIVVLSHMGVDYDQMAAAMISGIDVIVGGHTHTFISTPIQIGNTLVLQAGEFGRYLGKLSVILNAGELESWDYQPLSIDSSIPEEPTLAGLIAGLAAGIEADPRFGPVYSDVIAYAQKEISKPLGEELCKDNPLGNLVADSYRDLTGTEIAIQPQGFDSQTIYEGEIKGADIFQAVPYGFDPVSGLGLKLATFETDGMSLIAGLEFSVFNLPYVEDFFLHGSNLTYSYDLSAAPGSRVDYGSILIDGNPVDPSGIYSVTAPDGVVPFLYAIPGFNVNNLVITDYFVYNVVRDFITANSPVEYYVEGRVLDLSPMQDPAAGACAMRNVIGLFEENGSITEARAARLLDERLEKVAEHLGHDRFVAAYLGMMTFEIQVRLHKRRGNISDWSARQLLYLADNLMASIRNDAGYGLSSVCEGPIPESFELSQNYPNPFNPQTEITYGLPVDIDVNLTIYNTLGQKVAVLIDGYQNAGTHSVIWSGKDDSGNDAASGIYFYVLQASEYSQTKRMTLIR